MSFANARLKSFRAAESLSLTVVASLIWLKSGPSTEIVGYVSPLKKTVASLNGSKTSAISSNNRHSLDESSRCDSSRFGHRTAATAACWFTQPFNHIICGVPPSFNIFN